MASPAVADGRVTRERYWRMVADGVIGPDDRVELLEGVIVAMSPQSAPHAFVIARLDELLRATSAAVSVRVQLPLDLGEYSTPEPDVAVVAGRTADYATAHPTTALLVVEVADTTVVQDRMTKAAMYAAAGIPEYWLVNLRARAVEVFADPVAAERRYASTIVRRAGEVLAPSTLAGVAIPVGELLPPA
jgi:Uma2 family endonuclease